MRKPFPLAAILACCLVLNGCAEIDASAKKAVNFRYDHVANARQVRFTNLLSLPGFYPIHYVTPVDSQGFWAIFVICSLDVAGSELPSFSYNVSNFAVEYSNLTFGPLQPYTVRLQSSADLNSPANTPAIAQAIMQEVHVDPSYQTFPHAFYPSLNYRIAVYIPQALPGYGGDQLTLRYTGQPSLVLGGGHAPVDMPIVGGGAGNPLGSCRS